MKTGVFIITLAFIFMSLIGYGFGAEVDTLMALKTSPTLGNYHIQYLPTYINKDPVITQSYNLLVNLEFDRAVSLLSPYLRKAKPKTASEKALISEGYTYLGYCWLNLRNHQKTLAALTKATELNPLNETAYFYLANEYLHIGRTAEMKFYLHKTLELNPNFIAALRLLGESYKDEGNTKQALIYYKRIVNKLPTSAYYRFQYYRALMSDGSYEEARHQMEALIKLEPDFKINRARLAEIYRKQKKYDLSLKEYDKLIADPRYEQLANIGKASVYIETNNIKSAKKHLKKADTLGARGAEAIDVAYRLEMLQQEKGRDLIKYTIIILMILFILGATIISLRQSKRKKELQDIVSDFNKKLESIYDVKELGFFLTNFFCKIFGTDRCMLFLYNRQNNSLATVNPERENREYNIKIVTGNEVGNWVLQESRLFMSVDEVEKSKLFTEAFPSLAQRLKEVGMNYIIVLKDKNTCVGFIVTRTQRDEDFNKQKDVIESLVNISAQALQTLHLFESSIIDELTGLYNKRYFSQTLTAEIKKSDRYKQPCSLCTFDIDDFKKINDIFGHAQGDQVLREIGGIIRDSIRDGIDTGVRAGGEEFQIILPATNPELARIVAERIRSTIAGNLFQGFEPPKRITVSMGISTYPDFACTETDIIENADKALYMAKRSGKNKVISPHEMDSSCQKTFKTGMLLENRFDHLNIRDEQTGLFNFSYFSMRLKEEIKRAERYKKPCSLIIMSLYSPIAQHITEEGLKTLAGILKIQHREGIDTPAKFNDKTVLLLSPETGPVKAGEIAVRIRKICNKKKLDEKSPDLAIAIATASFPDCAQSADELMNRAESTLKEALSNETLTASCKKL